MSDSLTERRVKAAVKADLNAPLCYYCEHGLHERTPEVCPHCAENRQRLALAAADRAVAEAGSEVVLREAALAMLPVQFGPEWDRLSAVERGVAVVAAVCEVRAAMPLLVAAERAEAKQLQYQVDCADRRADDAEARAIRVWTSVIRSHMLEASGDLQPSELLPELIRQHTAALRQENERLRTELEFARTMAPPNVFGAHTMAGLLSAATDYHAHVARLQEDAATLRQRLAEVTEDNVKLRKLCLTELTAQSQAMGLYDPPITPPATEGV